MPIFVPRVLGAPSHPSSIGTTLTDVNSDIVFVIIALRNLENSKSECVMYAHVKTLCLLEKNNGFTLQKSILSILTFFGWQMLPLVYEDTFWGCSNQMSYDGYAKLLQLTHRERLEQISASNKLEAIQRWSAICRV